MQTAIDPKKRPPQEGILKCTECGHEEPNRDVPYIEQSDCPNCRHERTMKSRWYNGWDKTEREKRELRKHWRDLETERKRRAAEPVSQESDSIWDFTREERRIHNVLTFSRFGEEAPWMSPLGACVVKIYGIRHADDGSVEFGIGNEEPPILAWVHAKDFYNEWPQ